MSKIVLISCVKSKLPTRAKAKNLYISNYFKKSLLYAEMQNPDKIYILSAKYGLLDLERIIEPYEKTLNKMPVNERREWASNVLRQLNNISNFERDDFIFIGGAKYRQYIIPNLRSYQIPLEGESIGNQLKIMKGAITAKSKNCHELHALFNKMSRHQFPYNESQIPKNGLYILFEKGEQGHGTDRIVRIGTHTGKNQLRSRLQQHFIQENKDRSIFRKNIGRALLTKMRDPFLNQWQIDLTTRKAKQKNAHKIDFDKQKKIEKKVTRYIQNNFSFVAFQVDDKDKRLKLESKIISSINQCPICRPSERWLGNNSPKAKIQESGLWQVNELNKTPLTDPDIKGLQKMISANAR